MWKVFKHWYQLLFQIIEKKKPTKTIELLSYGEFSTMDATEKSLKQKSKYQKNMEAYQSQQVVHPIIVS